MPSLEYDDYKERCARRKAREKKLIAKGLIPGSTKFLKLMSRPQSGGRDG